MLGPRGWYIAPQCVTTGLLPPHGFFGPTKTVELSDSKRRFCSRKKFVELWRLDNCSGEHGVRLTTMMNLMLEEMHEETVTPFDLHPRIAIDPHDAAQEIRR